MRNYEYGAGIGNYSSSFYDTYPMKKKKGGQGHDDMALKLKALAHPARLEILEILKNKCCICGEIVDELPLAQATVSQHLKVLKDAGFIIGETEGTKVCYMLNRIAMDRFKEALSSF